MGQHVTPGQISQVNKGKYILFNPDVESETIWKWISLYTETNDKNKRKKEQIESDICHINTKEDVLIHLLTHRQEIVSHKIRIIV